MGLMQNIVGGALSGGGEAAVQVGMAQIKAAIEAERDARLEEMRLRSDATMRERNKADAAAERERIAAYSKPGIMQANPEVAANIGANDVERGEENPGVDVQNRTRTPTAREAQQRAAAAGDIPAMNAFALDANRIEDNARQDKQQAAQQRNFEDQRRLQEKQLDETLRHNKALEAQAAANHVSPAAKLQLDGVSLQLNSAHRAESEAAKALETARKDMADPAAIAQLESEYRAAKATTAATHVRYNETGVALFGKDKWKIPEMPVAVGVPKVPPVAAVEALMKGKKGADPTQFDQHYELPAGTGAAIMENSKKTPTPGASSSNEPKTTPTTDASNTNTQSGEYELVSKHGGKGGTRYIVKERGKPNGIMYQKTVSEAEAKRLGVI